MRWLAPVALAVVFAFAAGAKLADREGTEEGFRALGLPAPGRLAVLVPVAELLVAVLVLVGAPEGAILALLLLAAFSWVLGRAVVSGSTAPCKCFGGVRTRPVSWRDLARNGVLAVLALVTLVWPPS